MKLFMNTVTVSLTNSSVMNIVGVSVDEATAKNNNDEIMVAYRRGDLDDFINKLVAAGVNVYLDEEPFRMGGISDTRRETFKTKLNTFLNEKGGKFNIGANSVLPIDVPLRLKN